MKNPRTLIVESLSNGRLDSDLILLHVNFQVLTNCIEKNGLFEKYKDWDFDEHSRQVKHNILFLYEWWNKRKLLDQDNAIDDTDTVQYKEDDQMLKRLIDIRQHLWI